MFSIFVFFVFLFFFKIVTCPQVDGTSGPRTCTYSARKDIGGERLAGRSYELTRTCGNLREILRNLEIILFSSNHTMYMGVSGLCLIFCYCVCVVIESPTFAPTPSPTPMPTPNPTPAPTPLPCKACSSNTNPSTKLSIIKTAGGSIYAIILFYMYMYFFFIKNFFCVFQSRHHIKRFTNVPQAIF